MKPDHRPAGKIEDGVRRAYFLFLRAYPAQFRQTYAAEMAEVFSERVEEAARQGRVALLCLAAREIQDVAGAILRAYWLNRNRYLAFFWGLVTRFFKTLFQPEPPGSPDGRTSRAQAGLEAALFALLGAGQVAVTYAPNPGWGSFFDLLTGLSLSIPLVWLLVGLARGMPRWAYPALGVLSGYGFFASLATGAFPLICFFTLAALALLAWAYRVDRKRSFLPEVFHAWRHSLSADPTRLSFGFYGLLALAITVAFDDAVANNRSAWLLAAVLAMLGGAIVYSRSRNPAAQLGALAGGVTLSLLAALLDHARFAAPGWPGPVWVYTLWLNLLAAILLPYAGAHFLRFCRARLSRSAPRG
jgi:hypothetical protein